MEISIIEQAVSRDDLSRIAERQFGNFVKAVVDVEKNIMAIGPELHADAEALLLEKGSRQEDLWGINLYLGRTGEDWIEFDSMINIRPSQKNFSRHVESPEIQQKIREVVVRLVK